MNTARQKTRRELARLYRALRVQSRKLERTRRAWGEARKLGLDTVAPERKYMEAVMGYENLEARKVALEKGLG